MEIALPFALRILSCFIFSAMLIGGKSLVAEPPEPDSSRIEIYPSRIVVSRQYPARFMAIETSADGSSVDRTREVAAALMELPHRSLSIDKSGLLARNADALPNSVVARCETQIGGQPVVFEATVLEDANPSPVFAREISAIMSKSGCNLGTCHGNLHGKGGFRLSLRGDDAELDYASIVRGDSGRRLNLFAPELSLLLKKPTGQVAHQGGMRFEVGSVEYETLNRWIAEGSRWNADSVSPSSAIPSETLTQLDVHPRQAILRPESREQQVVVTASFADGSTRDVTRWARYEPSLATDIAISSDGLVTASKPLDVSISVSYLNGRAATRLTFLPEQRYEDRSNKEQNSLPLTRIDQIVENQLKRMRLQPTEPVSDNVFLRRLYLVVVGRVPTVSEAQSFLSSDDPDKRERLTEVLLNDIGYSALWSMRWSDLLRNEQKVMSPEGARRWHAWVMEQVSIDRRLDEFVAEMITTIGSTYEHPPASFHRTHRDPETAAESIGQVFLGVRLQCARCHNHPFDRWRQDDYYGLAAYFTTIERKQVDNEPKDKFDKHIISGDEVVSLSNKAASIMHPGRSSNVPPKPLTDTFRTDTSGTIASSMKVGVSPLDSLAEWLTINNRMFARNMANRVWFHLMGRGIVDPPDDFRDSNPASNPELLEFLTEELIRSNYSVRHLTKLILGSRTFARSAVDDIHVQGLDAEANFAGYAVRRMSAEVLMDALSDVTQVVSKVEEQATAPTSLRRAVTRPEVPAGSGFLATFGKPNRLLVCECERSDAVSLGQSLMLVNGADMRDKLAESKNMIAVMLNAKDTLPQAIDQLYMATLTRLPTTVESQQMVNYVTQASNPRTAFEDVLWALINSQEFAVIR